MEEHEQLKEICDIIWYDSYIYSREIIFTQLFWNRLCDTTWCDMWGELEDHLDDPVSYLYNIIKWTK